MMQLYNIRHELLYICESPKSVNESESLCSLWVSWGTDRFPGTTGLLQWSFLPRYSRKILKNWPQTEEEPKKRLDCES